MTIQEIKNTPEIVDFMLDESVTADSREKLRKRLEKVCNLAIKALEQEPKWIPITERLPKTAGVYRVTRYPNSTSNSNYLVDACYFDGSDTWYSDNRINHGRPYANNVIAWQENPEPYKLEYETENKNKCKKCEYYRNPDYTRCHKCKNGKRGN